MKGMKSKGKKTKQPTTHRPPIRNVRGSARTGKKNASKQFTVQFLDGRVVFNISQVTPVLQRTLIYAFKDKTHDLSQSSILLRLKIPKPRNYEVTYRHYLDTKEAINLYNRMMRKKIGEINKQETVKQMIGIIESYPVQSQQQLEEQKQQQFEMKRQKLNRRIEHLRRQVKTFYLSLKEDIKNKYNNSQQHSKAQILQHRIRLLSAQLIDKMIVAIQQINLDRVNVIFEHPYPEKSCSPQFLIQAIGRAKYIQKKMNFVKYYRHARIHHVNNTNFMVCHHCKQLLSRLYLACDQQFEGQFEATYYNSPNIYHRNLLALDYCYHPQTEWRQQQLQQQLDYFRYFSNGEINVCNRMICQKCAVTVLPLLSYQELYNYKCQFCKKCCSCEGCKIAKQLVKTLALYKQIMVNNFQPLDTYFELIAFANLDHPTKVEVQSHVRESFEHKESSNYWMYYSCLLQNYKCMNDVMDKLQLEMVRSHSISQDVEMVVSQEMKYVRKYCLSMRQEQTFIPKTSKYFHSVMQSNRRVEQRKKTKKYRENLKQLLEQSSQQDLPTFWYQVEFQVNDLTQLEVHLGFDEYQIKRIKEKRLKFLKAMKPGKERKVFRIQRQWPFDQIDYQLAANVKKESKLLVEKDFQLMKNAHSHIMFNDQHPIYGFKGIPSTRFPSEQDQFIDLLQVSDQSESSEQFQEGDSSIRNPSVSLSSHFLKRHSIKLYEQISPFSSSQSRLEEASSALILNLQPPESKPMQQPEIKLQAQNRRFGQKQSLKRQYIEQRQLQVEAQLGAGKRVQQIDSQLQQIPQQQWHKFIKQ